MPYARIFIKDENKQQDVNVEEILDFWSVYLGNGDPLKKVFRLIYQDKLINCQVLRLAGECETYILIWYRIISDYLLRFVSTRCRVKKATRILSFLPRVEIAIPK